ncbi:MAG: NAD(P)/FAD-dependent oxidoreductase [Flavobacteriales bacterium]|nr:NAD(P)/FAD-dependent oxidoreductase [Flavobacteriales bacterium]
MNKNSFDVIIIGGGLAGLLCSIDLHKRGFSVLVIEKKSYPLHKVCGEYISNEVLPYLKRLGYNPSDSGAKEISRFMISSSNGASETCEMEMGGFSLSRYKLDHDLFELASSLGVELISNTAVTEISFNDDESFEVKTVEKTYGSNVVIGAYGKRSNIDKGLGRDFFSKRTSYLGVKHHFKGEHEDDLVCLHNFDGGYCGVSKVENGLINISYLITNDVLKRYKNINELEQVHLSKNPFLKNIFENSTPVFEKPLVISQINFGIKQTVEKHVLMIGDAAGMIHPLCGNGMAMAIHSTKLCSNQVSEFLSQKISRKEMESRYRNVWDKAFKRRLKLGNLMQPLFGKGWTSNTALRVIKILPSILPKVVSLSHGAPIQ